MIVGLLLVIAHTFLILRLKDGKVTVFITVVEEKDILNQFLLTEE